MRWDEEENAWGEMLTNIIDAKQQGDLWLEGMR